MNTSISAILKSEESANLGNTIWRKFAMQIKDLMEELGESTLTKKSTEGAEACELHFIRCIKPNELAHKNMFVHSLVLLQITYMGVLDTIKVRKANYPHRLTYMRFYERYEDLCSVSLSTPFRLLVKQNPNYIELAKQLIKEQFGSIGQDQYLFGKTRIFIKNKMMSLMETARGRAQSSKNQAANFIHDCLNAFKARQVHKSKIQSITKLVKYYKKRYRINFARRAIKFGMKLEQVMANYKTEKLREIEETVSIKIAAMIKAATIKKIVKKGFKARKVMGSSLIRSMGKFKVHKAIINVNIVLKVFDRAWSEITRTMLSNIARVLIKYSRGFTIRKLYQRQIVLAKEKA
jgi:myosin heavy subunit